MKTPIQKTLLGLAGFALFAMSAPVASAQFDYLLDITRTGLDAATWAELRTELDIVIFEDDDTDDDIAVYSDADVYQITFLNVSQTDCDEADALVASLRSEIPAGLLDISNGCVPAGEVSVEVQRHFVDPADLGDGWYYSEWFELFYAGFAPWVYNASYDIGWLYVLGDPDGFIEYSLDLDNWLWTDEDLFPWFYNFNLNAWDVAPLAN